MKRDHVVSAVIVVGLIALIVWIAMHTYWGETTIWTPMKGEAARNPYYSLELLATNLGIRSREIASLRDLPPDAVVLVNDLHDDFLHQSIESLESWVDAGGRLIITGSLLRSSAALQSWSGVLRAHRDVASKPPLPAYLAFEQNCAPMTVQVASGAPRAPLTVCARAAEFCFTSRHEPTWSLSDAQGIQVLRVDIGSGELTVIGPYGILSNRNLLLGDHAEVLIAAAGLERRDTLLILRPPRPEPLLALLWRWAAPAIVFLAGAMVLLILRHLPRFGPPLPVEVPVRRSLAEQIRANARFAWRTRRLEPLRRAVKRALEEEAQRQIAGFRTLDLRRRADSLAVGTGIDTAAINAALKDDAGGNVHEHQAAITLLEACRRILLKRGP